MGEVVGVFYLTATRKRDAGKLAKIGRGQGCADNRNDLHITVGHTDEKSELYPVVV